MLRNDIDPLQMGVRDVDIGTGKGNEVVPTIGWAPCRILHESEERSKTTGVLLQPM